MQGPRMAELTSLVCRAESGPCIRAYDIKADANSATDELIFISEEQQCCALYR